MGHLDKLLPKQLSKLAPIFSVNVAPLPRLEYNYWLDQVTSWQKDVAINMCGCSQHFLTPALFFAGGGEWSQYLI